MIYKSLACHFCALSSCDRVVVAQPLSLVFSMSSGFLRRTKPHINPYLMNGLSILIIWMSSLSVLGGLGGWVGAHAQDCGAFCLQDNIFGFSPFAKFKI